MQTDHSFRSVRIPHQDLRQLSDALVVEAAAEPVGEAAVFPVQQIEEPIAHALLLRPGSAAEDVFQAVDLPVNL